MSDRAAERAAKKQARKEKRLSKRALKKASKDNLGAKAAKNRSRSNAADNPFTAAAERPDLQLENEFSQLLMDLNIPIEGQEKMKKELTQQQKRAYLRQHSEKAAKAASASSTGTLRNTPEFFVKQLRVEPTPSVYHRLRVCLTTESVEWMNAFINANGLGILLDGITERERKRVKDDEDTECIRGGVNCIIDMAASSLQSVLGHPDVLLKLCLCLDTRDASVKKVIYDFFSLMCACGEGAHRTVQAAMDHYKYVKRENVLYLHLMETLRHAAGDETLIASCLQLINSIVSTPEDLAMRISTRLVFTRLGLVDFLNRLKGHTQDKDVLLQIQTFFEEMEEDKEAMQDSAPDYEALANASETQVFGALIKRAAPFPDIKEHVGAIVHAMYRLPIDVSMQGPRLWSLTAVLMGAIADGRRWLPVEGGFGVDMQALLQTLDISQNLALREADFANVKAALQQEIARLKEQLSAGAGAQSETQQRTDAIIAELQGKLLAQGDQLLEARQEASTAQQQHQGTLATLGLAQQQLAKLQQENADLRAQLQELLASKGGGDPAALQAANAEIQRLQTQLEMAKDGSGTSASADQTKTTTTTTTTTPPAPSVPVMATDAPPPPPPPGPVGGPPPPPPPGGGGPPPPPPPGGGPPPPPGAPGFAALAPRKPSSIPKPKVAVRQVNWSKIPKFKVKDTMFGSLADGMENMAKKINFDEMETLFRAPEKSAFKKTESNKPKTVSLISAKRAQNVAIFLKSGKIPPETVKSAILMWDQNVLTPDYVERLLENVPDDEELKAVKKYMADGGDISILGKAEQFFIQIMDISFLRPRLEAMHLHLTFQERFQVNKKIIKVRAAMAEIRKGEGGGRWSRMLETVLCLGNFLNGKGARGNAVGIDLQSLNKLRDTRTCDNKSNLLNYLVHILEHIDPDVLSLREDFQNVEACTNIAMQSIREGVGSLNKAVQSMLRVVDNVPEADASVDRIKDVLSDTVAHRLEIQVRGLRDGQEGMQTEWIALARAYGLDPKAMDPQGLFRLLVQFMDSLEAARKANIEKKEKEEKKKQQLAKKARNLGKPKTNVANQALLELQKRQAREAEIARRAAGAAPQADMKAIGQEVLSQAQKPGVDTRSVGSLADRRALIAAQNQQKKRAAPAMPTAGVGFSMDQSTLDALRVQLKSGDAFQNRRTLRRAKRTGQTLRGNNAAAK